MRNSQFSGIIQFELKKIPTCSLLPTRQSALVTWFWQWAQKFQPEHWFYLLDSQPPPSWIWSVLSCYFSDLKKKVSETSVKSMFWLKILSSLHKALSSLSKSGDQRTLTCNCLHVKVRCATVSMWEFFSIQTVLFLKIDCFSLISRSIYVFSKPIHVF